jgi:molecular chaperone DnaJ
MKDYYKILEVEENASDDDIKKSYRNLSKKYHPDLNPDGAEKFKEIAEAYEILGNKDKRSKYDSDKNNPFAGTSFQDMFSQMFGNMNPNINQQRRRKQAPDKILRLKITPIESYLGSEKLIQFMRDFGCNTCNGAGGEQQACMGCGGLGYQVKTLGTGFMTQKIRTACTSCAGRGYTLVHKCISCDGRGVKTSVSEVKIKLPVSCDNGQYLRLENFGDFKFGEYGDLIVQIEMEPNGGYEKINDDLIYNLIVNLDEIQQEKFIIPHPDGNLSMEAPKVIDTSKPLRLRGKGYNGGDMYVKLNLRFERN